MAQLFMDGPIVLKPLNLCLWHRITAAVGGLQLRNVARDALLNPPQTPFHLGSGEVLISRIDSFEFGSVNGDARLAQQIKLAAQCHEGTANLTNGLALSLRKSAMVLKSGTRCPVNQISSMLRWHSRSKRRLDGTRLR